MAKCNIDLQASQQEDSRHKEFGLQGDLNCKDSPDRQGQYCCVYHSLRYASDQVKQIEVEASSRLRSMPENVNGEADAKIGNLNADEPGGSDTHHYQRYGSVLRSRENLAVE